MDTVDAIEQLRNNVERNIVGQVDVINRLIVALLVNGHVLLEGLPGLAKTRAIKSLAKSIEANFSRIQFTADLLPSDVTGTEIYLGEGQAEAFVFKHGPVFGNFVLADEINRAPAKVQGALLEAMEERQVTVGGKTYAMEPLFMVLATQNPIEQEGTFPLPEAQMDRFLLHVFVQHPTKEEELSILDMVRGEEKQGAASIEALPQSVIFDARQQVKAMPSSKALDQYVVDLVDATRHPKKYSDDIDRWLMAGVSPRATLALEKTARGLAWLEGSDRVLPSHVQAMAADCLRHRLLLSYDATAEGVTADQVIQELLSVVAMP